MALGFCAGAQIVRIHRHFKERSTGEESDDVVLGITSLLPLADPHENAAWLLEIARGQWTIENGNHYVRDRTYDEDRCQVRNPNSAQILATLRSPARFLAKQGWHRPHYAPKRRRAPSRRVAPCLFACAHAISARSCLRLADQNAPSPFLDAAVILLPYNPSAQI